MASEPTSRFRYARIFTDDVDGSASKGMSYLGFREPVRFRDDPDNVTHIVRAGDNLQSLAHSYFNGMPEAANLWWVIAEFQPTPIIDPTKRLLPGSLLVIPAPNLVNALIAADTPAQNVRI